MNRNYFLWIVGFALVSLGLIFSVMLKEINSPITHAKVPLAQVPYSSYIAGVGIVEASSGNVMIRALPERRVETVFVKDGQNVKKGEPLFALNSNDLKDKLKAEQVALKLAVAKLERIKSLPRAEDVEASESQLAIAQAEMETAAKQHQMVQDLKDPRSISLEEQHRRLSNFQQAEAKWRQAEADWKKVTAGAWKPDLEIAKLEVQEARANIDRTQGEIEQTVVKSPLDATVLQINIHEGEYASNRLPALVVGQTSPLYVRVSINQLDISRFQPQANATAYLQGDLSKAFPLEFVRIEPLLVDKVNLTGEITEKVDTKVLHILYLVKKNPQSLIVGQQMDVFIESKNGMAAKT